MSQTPPVKIANNADSEKVSQLYMILPLEEMLLDVQEALLPLHSDVIADRSRELMAHARHAVTTHVL